MLLGNLIRNKNKSGKYIAAVGVLLAMSLLFIFMFVNLAIDSTLKAIEIGEPDTALYVMASMTFIFIVLMTITKSSTPTKASDEELLLSLPVKKSEIIIAKIFYDYLFDLVMVAITLLPSLIVYVVLVKTSTLLIFRGVVIILLLPMFSSAIGYFIGLFFSLLASKFKYFGIIQSVFTILFLLAFMVSYYGITIFVTNDSMAGADIFFTFLPFQWMVSYIESNNFLSFLILFSCTFLPFLGSIFLKTIFIGKASSRYRSKKKELSYKVLSPMHSLYKREAARYFSLPVYVVNTIFGGILLVIIGVILATLGKSYIDNLLIATNLLFLQQYNVVLIVLIIQFSVATICTTAASISLEGKTLWILKAHPISCKDIFWAKILFNLTIAIVPIVISSTCICTVIGFQYWIVLVGLSVLTSMSVSILGLLFNLIYPRLEWESETTPIKQGMSVLISLGVGMLVAIFPTSLYFLFSFFLPSFVCWIVIGIISMLIVVCNYIILVKKGVKLFIKLN